MLVEEMKDSFTLDQKVPVLDLISNRRCEQLWMHTTKERGQEDIIPHNQSINQSNTILHLHTRP